MFGIQKSKTKASSRQQIAVKEVRDGILILPGKQYRRILEVSALNFELKSEAEQDAIIDTYESFLNSIGSSLQIVVRTREVDIDNYILSLASRAEGETKSIYKSQLQNYITFIRSLVQDNKILSRRFFVVVSQHGKSHGDFEVIQEQIRLKSELTIKGLARLGMHVEVLGSLEAIELFYSFYNQSRSKTQPFTTQALRFMNDMIITKEVRI